MNSEQRRQIRSLIARYSGSGTESLIAFVAGTNGMLAACQALLRSIDATGSTSAEWLQLECAEESVAFHSFLLEVGKIVDLFHPAHDLEAPHLILGVAADADSDEIKQAYRTLSLRYHPDTASPPYRDNPEKFIAITKAYQTLMNEDTRGEEENIQPENQWRRKQERKVSPEQRKTAIKWTMAVVIVLAVVSTIAAINYKKRAMLAGLQESRGGVIPPVRKAADVSADKEDMARYKQSELPPVVRAPAAKPGLDPVPKIQTELKMQMEPKVFEDISARKKNPEKKNPDTLIEAPLSPESIAAKESAEVAVLAIRTSDRAIPGLKQHQSTPEQHTGSGDSESVFTTQKQVSAANNMSVRPDDKDRPADATVTEAEPSSVAPFQADTRRQEKSVMQSRVDRFFADYTQAYEQRNLILFARFFEAEAEENGQPFTAALPTYLNLFASTRHISLNVGERSWHLVDGKIAVDGWFKIYLEYEDGRIINGSGPIGFILADNGGELLVNKMEYVFHTD
jgi:curved DNA-binding protein CbpA